MNTIKKFCEKLKKIGLNGLRVWMPVVFPILLLIYFWQHTLVTWRRFCQAFGGVIGGSLIFLVILLIVIVVFDLCLEVLLNFKKSWQDMREATNCDSNYELIIKIVLYLLAIPLGIWVASLENNNTSKSQLHQSAPIMIATPTINTQKVNINITPTATLTATPTSTPHPTPIFPIPDQIWENYSPSLSAIKNAT